MIFRFALLLGALLASPASLAASFWVTTGYGRGGSALSGATGGQNYDIHAGDGLFLVGGILLPVTPTKPDRFEAQLGAGFLFQSQGQDDETDFYRVPLEAIYFYRNTESMFRVGWGLTYQIANSIAAKGANSTAAMHVDNALGWIVTAEKLFDHHNSPQEEKVDGFWGLGLRYSSIKYRSASFSHDVDGSSLSLVLSAAFL